MSENLENIVEDTTSMEQPVQEEVQNKEPLFTIKDLLEAGVHYGHKTMRWNPKMAPYIYGTRNGLHIIDLTQTAILFKEALKTLKEIVKKQGKILFVCTKKQGSEIIAKMAENCNQYYVNYKWLGGMLTNWKTISQSIRKIKFIENQIKLSDDNMLVKKEVLKLEKQKAKLEKNFNGIKSMGGKPDLIFVIDAPKEALAISEAKALGIPVMAIVDTNANPDNIDYIIPGNDDSIKAVEFYCDMIEKTLKDIKINPIKEVTVLKKPTLKNKKVTKLQGKKVTPKKVENTTEIKEEEQNEKQQEK